LLCHRLHGGAPVTPPLPGSPTALISVIVTCDGLGRYLQDALDSIGTSTLPVEKIAVDGRCANSRAVAAARNAALQQATGEYIVFLHAGDRLAPGALELGAAKLEEHPEAAFVFGRCLPIDEDGTVLSSVTGPRIVRDHYRELLRHNYIRNASMVMFRRQALVRAGGFNELMAASSDYDLYLHIARHHPVHDHGQVVAFCRRRAVAAYDPSRMLGETLEILRSQRPFLEADEASLQAYAQGWTTAQEHYGSLLVEEIRAGVKDREWLAAMQNVATLGWYHPRGLWHHARRFTRFPHRLWRPRDARIRTLSS
jgi:glycosyltransferase involved in cell wall biosynthesis